MNNKKLIYILITIITLFSFNMNVKAAQELTCVYEKGGVDVDKVILIQNSSGEKVIYTNVDDASKNGANWEKKNYTIGISPLLDLEVALDMTSNLVSCPKYSKLLKEENAVSFYNTHYDLGYQPLDEEESTLTVEYVEGVKTTAPKSVTNPKSDMLIDLDNNKYVGSCKYRRGIDNNIRYIQINYGLKDILITEYDNEKGTCSGLTSCAISESNPFGPTVTYSYHFRVDLDKGFSSSYFLDILSGNCPKQIYVSQERPAGAYYTQTFNTTILHNDNKRNGITYMLDSVSGKNPITNEPLSTEISYGKDITFVAGNIENCKDLFGDKLYGYFNVIWNLVKIGIPIILIGLGIADFAQAVFSGKEDNMKKAQGKFIKRVIIAVAIFLIPTLIGLLLNIANEVWPNIKTDICGIVF